MGRLSIRRRNLLIALATAALPAAMPECAHALTTYYWGGANGGDWFAANQWKTTSNANFTMPQFGDPNYVLIFRNAGANLESNFINAFLNCYQLVTDPAVSEVDTSVSNTLTLQDGGILHQSAANYQLLQGGSGTLSGRTGPLNVNVTNAAGVLNINIPIANYTPLSSITTLNKSGSGRLVLAGASTFTGATTINGGTLEITGSSVSPSTTVNSGGTLLVNSFNGWAGYNLTVNSGGTATTGNNVNNDVQDITLAGGTISSGTPDATYGSWYLLGNITATGNTTSTISAQRFSTTATNHNITVDPGSTLNVTGGFEDGGSITKLGGGTLVFAGSNSYSGLTTVNNGTLILNGTSDKTIVGNISVASGAFLQNLNHEMVADTSNITINGTWNMGGKQETFATLSGSGTVNGGGIVLKPVGGTATFAGTLSNLYFNIGDTSSGTQILTGDSSVGVTADFNAGTLQIGNGGTSGSFAGFIRVRSGAALNFNRDGTLTHANQIDGAGNVYKNGAGTVILSGTNTYTGSTTINLGTLQIGGGTTSGALSTSSTITNNANIVFNRSNTITQGTDFSGSGITGTGSLTQAGSGTLILNASNSYTGDTTVNGGVIDIPAGGSVSNNVGRIAELPGATGTVIVNGTWSNSNGLVVGQSGSGNLSIGAGGHVSSGGNGHIAFEAGSTGAVTVAGGTWNNSVDLVVGRLGNGILSIGTGGSVANFTGRIGQISGSTGTVTVNGGTWSSSVDLYVGQGGNGNLNIGSGGLVSYGGAGFIAYGAGSTGTVTVTGGTWNTASLLVGRSGSGNLNIGTGGLVSNGGVGFIANDAGSTGAATVTGGTWNTAGLLVGRSGNGNLAIGTGGLVSNGGNGLIAFEASSTGSVTVTGGTWNTSFDLVVGRLGNGTLNVGTGASVTNSTGRIAEISGSTGTASVTGGTWNNSSNLFVGQGGNGRLDIGVAGNVSAPAVIVGNDSTSSGTLNLSSGGILTTNSISKGSGTASFDFDGGTLRASANTTALFSNFSPTVNTSGAKIDTNGFDVTINSALVHNPALGASPDGGLTKLGSEILALTAANTYTGVTTISAGTLQIGDGGTTGSLSNLGTIDISSGANFAVNRADDVIQGSHFSGGVLTGSGGLTKLGAGKLTLTSGNSYTGTTMVISGTLEIGAGGTTGRVAGDIVNNAAVVFNRSNNAIYGGNVSGSGSLTKAGTGALILTANNTFTGGMTINQGTVVFQSAGRTPDNTAITINNGAALRITNGLGVHTSTTSPNLTLNAGGLLENLNCHGTFINPTLAGGAIECNGGYDFRFPSFAFKGTVNVTGSQASEIRAGGLANNGQTGVNIGVVGVNFGSTTFNVADVTSSGAADLLISVPIQDNGDISGGSTIPGALAKTGVGTMKLTGSNTYTGGTTITGGALIATNPAVAALLSTAGTDVQAGTRLIFDYTGGSAPDVRSALGNGKIHSSTATALIGLGYFDNGSTQILVQPAYYGDANLNGTVDSGDFTALAGAFNSASGTWQTGDFNYDGVVNALDFNALATNFGQTLAAPALGAVVPEPASLGLVCLAGASLTRRRRMN